jgi:hypothetical protein
MSFRRLSFAYFSLARQRKVGAAPHRGNANKPEAKQGKANKQANNQPARAKFFPQPHLTLPSSTPSIRTDLTTTDSS